MTDRPKTLLEVITDTIRRKHDSDRTEKSYFQWIKRYVIKNDGFSPLVVASKTPTLKFGNVTIFTKLDYKKHSSKPSEPQN